MNIWFYNPDNDMALANGDKNFVSPLAIQKMSDDLVPMFEHIKFDGDKIFYNVNDLDSRNIVNAKAFVWGWSPAVLNFIKSLPIEFLNLPSEDDINYLRDISHRKTSIEILKSLNIYDSDYPLPQLPILCSEIEEISVMFDNQEKFILKSPWSSSGKGIIWSKQNTKQNLLNRAKNILNKNRSIIIEKEFDKIIDFGALFYADENGSVSFYGFSLFNTDINGIYRGNVLASNEDIKQIITSFINRELLDNTICMLIPILKKILNNKYTGFFGIDMMIYKDCNIFHLHPCIELNLRMTMGVVASMLYKNIIKEGRGDFKIDFFKKSGDALNWHNNMIEQYKHHNILNNKYSKYLNLTPVDDNTSYIAYILY
ncbi:MAG: hypothetical protein Q4F97_02670 [Bacteroidales bacterium]|nr:hypothetical protein [Bacteroidales bacterium]